jgi:hypothetical protein
LVIAPHERLIEFELPLVAVAVTVGVVSVGGVGRFTVNVYVVVLLFSAVPITVITLSPKFRLIASEAAPDVTKVPFTVAV